MNQPLFFLDPFHYHQPPPAGSAVSMDIGYGQVFGRFLSDEFRISEECRIPFPKKSLLDQDDQRSILVWQDNKWEKWQQFDPATRKFYKMIFVAPGKPPTIEISGIKMHVTENSDPLQDTGLKLKHLTIAKGKALDTCCGLGYTAIALCQLPGIESVLSFEVDANMQKLCRQNPWSQNLYLDSAIKISIGNAADLIREVDSDSIAAIVHDPPRFALAAELYTDGFYQQLWRVLQRKGRLYHYTGDPNRRQRKIPLAEKTAERLKNGGFRRVRLAHQGVFAVK